MNQTHRFLRHDQALFPHWLAALPLSLALVTVAPAAADDLRRYYEFEDVLERFGLDAGATRSIRVPPGLRAGDVGRDIVFARPTGCTLKRRTAERKTMVCTAEERRLVTVGPHGLGRVRSLSDGPARNPYPLELTPQWRYCPFQRDAELDRTLVAYEDPDVGRCYALRPLMPTLGPDRRAHLAQLDKVHPYLADAVRRLMVLAWSRGDEFKVISTIRAPTKVVKTHEDRVKVGRKWKVVTTTSTRYKGGGWHAFGLAVDINLMTRKDLGSATSAYLRGGPERAAWLRIGAQGESFGLVWIGRNDPGEIFHFEWHPGWPGLPKGDLYQRLAAKADRDGLPAVWAELAHDGKRPTAFRHLQDPVVPTRLPQHQVGPEVPVEEVTEPKPKRKKVRRPPNRRKKKGQQEAGQIRDKPGDDVPEKPKPKRRKRRGR